ncbi:hypothetical protein TNIN_385911 [Trichonephila inaurata madagascariensis]|uniref:Uncharacterized protein n=1 Tax=Trichonephila inaurata madagascariensis TaxID=2747483 RepID=A0A8X6XX37_9ARAC|nr:hypothetical protein TNIN_385911 [Trichonephila inaurata madagascariensis]
MHFFSREDDSTIMRYWESQHRNRWMFVQVIELNPCYEGFPSWQNHSTTLGQKPRAFKFLRKINGHEITFEDLFTDTESDLDSDFCFDTDSESLSESENDPVLEFIPGTMDQLIQGMPESVNRR